MRFYGIELAMLVLLMLATLFFRNHLILRLWQGLLAVAVVMWLQTTAHFVEVRQAMGAPWLRLASIMGGVIAFTIYSIFSLENRKLKAFYQ